VLDPDVFVLRVLGVPGQKVDGSGAGPNPAVVEGDVGAGVEPDGVRTAEAQGEVAERDVVAVGEEDRVVLFLGQRQTEVVGVGLIRLVSSQPGILLLVGASRIWTWRSPAAWLNQIPGPM
jgi:hypothetical protein